MLGTGESQLKLRPEEVHVWAAGLHVGAPELAQLAEALSEPERKRAMRFYFEQHRHRFIAGHGFLRQLLGRYLGTEPASLEFDYGPFGKPQLSGAFGQSGLYFNLAHSEDLAVLAVTRAGAVGVDVEQVRPLADASELVARFFSPRENRAFEQLPEEQKALAFFNLWTRKEAWLKATGEGIGSSLHLVEVSFLPGEPAQLLSVPTALAGGRPWTLQDFTPAAGFAAAVAVAAPEVHLRCWNWGHS